MSNEPDNPEKTGCESEVARNSDGTYRPGVSGNPSGRPPKPKQNEQLERISQTLIEAAECILPQLIQSAFNGDKESQRFLINKVMPSPKSKPMSLEVPAITNAADALQIQAQAIVAAASGHILTHEAQALFDLCGRFIANSDKSEIEARITALEKKAIPKDS